MDNSAGKTYMFVGLNRLDEDKLDTKKMRELYTVVQGHLCNSKILIN